MAKGHTVVAGAGFAGLSAAACLAQMGHRVTILEKNETPGGRARSFTAQGYTWDMGPSWYWMPDVLEKFFNRFGKSASDYYELVRLDPSYRIYFEDGPMDIPARMADLTDLFEAEEPGSGIALKKFLQEAEYKYRVGMQRLVYKPGLSLKEYLDPEVVRGLFKLRLFSSFKAHVASRFSSPRLRQLLEFPVLFLGALPKNTPALYSLMNHADLQLGTWYPLGGMHKIAEALESLCRELGVEIRYGEAVESVSITGRGITAVHTAGSTYGATAVVSTMDYAWMDQHVLPEAMRDYSQQYWATRSMAPSCLIYYIGHKGRAGGLRHHNLFFDASFQGHADALYSKPQWPESPLFYACAPSITDPAVAPAGNENLFLLMPTAPGMVQTEEIEEKYYHILCGRLSHWTSGAFSHSNVEYLRSYGPTDFTADYNAHLGNAYGLANTLRQTAILKPRMQSRKLNNLFHAGQLTNPGPGLPPAIISGQVAAALANRYCTQLKKQMSAHAAAL